MTRLAEPAAESRIIRVKAASDQLATLERIVIRNRRGRDTSVIVSSAAFAYADRITGKDRVAEAAAMGRAIRVPASTSSSSATS